MHFKNKWIIQKIFKKALIFPPKPNRMFPIEKIGRIGCMLMRLVLFFSETPTLVLNTHNQILFSLTYDEIVIMQLPPKGNELLFYGSKGTKAQ